MNITVNGEITVCNEGATLLDLILRLGLSPEKIVVERNRDIVPAFLCLSSLMRRLLGGPDRRCSAPPGALFGAFFWGVCPVIFSECSLKDGL